MDRDVGARIVAGLAAAARTRALGVEGGVGVVPVARRRGPGGALTR